MLCVCRVIGTRCDHVTSCAVIAFASRTSAMRFASQQKELPHVSSGAVYRSTATGGTAAPALPTVLVQLRRRRACCPLCNRAYVGAITSMIVGEQTVPTGKSRTGAA